MINQQQQQKIPWPGDWALYSAGAKYLGLSNDPAGEEAINHWATTATQEEIDAMRKRAKSIGCAIGYFGSMPFWNRFWSGFFGG